MKITVDKSVFVDKFVTPISRMTDKCTIIVGKDKMDALCTTETKNPILFASIKCQTADMTAEEVTLNIPDIRRLHAGMKCIDDSLVDLIMSNSNSLTCSTDSMTFRYHLMEDGVIPKEIVSRKKIGELKFNSVFQLKNEIFSKLISGMSFAADAQKLYISYENGAVRGTLADKDISNIDTIAYTIAKKYEGVAISAPIPISTEIIKLISTSHKDCFVRINTETKTFQFTIDDKDYSLKYIVSPMTR